MAITRAQQARQMLKKGSKPIEQAGVMNYMPSEMVTVPKIAKSSPNTPTAKLAYITPEEQDILVDLNLYGSLKGKPNRGPGGIPSLEGDFGSPTGDTYSGGSAGEDGGSRRGPPPGSPDYNRTATFTPSPTLPPGVQKAVDEGRPTSIKTKEDEKRAKKEVQEFLKETGQKKSFIESFNEKKKKKNQEYLRNLRNKKFEGIAAAYGLSSEQMQKLLDAYSEDEDEFDLSTFRSIVDAGAPPSIIRSDPNFLKAQELALSKGMAKGNKLSTGALFSTTDPTTRIDLPGILGKVQGPETFSNVLSGLNRIQTLDEIINNPKGVTQSDIDNYFNLTMGKGGTDPVTGETVDALFSDQTGGRDDTPIDPCKGPNPPAYCFIGEKAEETVEAQRNLAGLTPRLGGSIFDFSNMAEGGLADMDREAFLLGGIAKGLKKAVRGVKKIAKSPLGKAAILGAVGFGLGSKGALGSFFGKGSFNPFLRTVAGDTAFSGLGSILSKAGLVSKAGLPTFKGGIALASILPLLVGKTDKEKDQILKDYYASQELSPATTARQTGSEFDFYNYNLAEGGTPRKEPVAKKVMPLLDMGGMEKDYRAEGGFVPIGRMEKADDVPARLSKNEFVFTADAVRNAGDGDVDKGAEVMYNMMKNLEAGGEVSEESQGLDGAREMFQTSQRLGEVI